MLRKIILLILPMVFATNLVSPGQKVDTVTFMMNTRLSFYSWEEGGEILMHIPSGYVWSNLNITLNINNEEVATWKGVPRKKILIIPVDFKGLSASNYTITADIESSKGTIFRTSAQLNILPPKPNEVKTDRFTGGLIVNRLIFIPFGFYCYSPVNPKLPEEEVVKGFNMISPYQLILPASFKERKAYMDRCAEIGMKVHYNLLSVSGGGGVSSDMNGISESQKRELLIAEIKAMMDHPALLAWYISDEPNGYKIPPSQLKEIYNTIKEIDPWHPVSIVFTAPFLTSKKYEDAFDIVMADPYPVPNGSVLQVGTITKQLRSEFEGKKPVWIVPQTFGGGEWWGREPTVQEIRNMTYQAIVQGARGIQYFIRHGPNLFPKSVPVWNECGRMAMEIAEITPWLLSDEITIPVTIGSGNVNVSSYIVENQLLIIVVNRMNSPVNFNLKISGITNVRARVLFENRIVSVNSGTLSDYLSAYGSQIYLMNTKPLIETIIPYKGNLTKDPGFEDLSSPGVPAACYSWNEGDRGSTYFLDSREHYEGRHSLRIVTPQRERGIRLRFFPVNIEKGQTYIISIMAKSDLTLDKSNGKPYFELGLGDYGREVFIPDNDWKQFITSVTIPCDTIQSDRVNAVLRMPGKGTAWFDMIQVFEAVDINRSFNPEIKKDLWDNDI
jgi:hypothetical protein